MGGKANLDAAELSFLKLAASDLQVWLSDYRNLSVRHVPDVVSPNYGFKHVKSALKLIQRRIVELESRE